MGKKVMGNGNKLIKSTKYRIGYKQGLRNQFKNSLRLNI